MEALDMLANNLSNASTSGFKRDGEFYAIYEEAETQATSLTGMLPLIEKPWTDLSQGNLQSTGKNLDFALSGPGWFSVNGPSGPLYTRSGSFHASAAGILSTQEGYSVRLLGGGTPQIRPGVPVESSMDGTLLQSGVPIGKLEVLDFPDNSLIKQGATLFRPADPKTPGTPVPNTEVHQGKLEGSNVSSPEAAVRLINLTRQFEALQRAITIGADMNRRSVEELARVGS